MIKNNNKNLYNQIVIVDGYSANGKALISSYLQTFTRIQIMDVNTIFGQIGALKYLNKIDKYSAINLLKIKADTSLQNNVLSRNLNIRPFDESSVFRSYNKINFFKNIFRSDGDNVSNYINKDNPILHIMTHFSKPYVDFFFETFEKNLVFISCIRHPVYFFDYWSQLIRKIHNKNPRLNFILKNNKNTLIEVPWFFYPLSNYDNVDENNIGDVFINIYDWLETESNKSLKKLNNNYMSNVITIPFERFIVNNVNYENQISQILDVNSTNSTIKFNKKNKLNLGYFSDRKTTRKKNGFILNKITQETQNKYEKKLNKIKNSSKNNTFDKFLKLILDYEYKYDINFISTKKYIN